MMFSSSNYFWVYIAIALFILDFSIFLLYWTFYIWTLIYYATILKKKTTIDDLIGEFMNCKCQLDLLPYSKLKKITTSSMSIYCIHMMSCLVSIIVSSVSFASVMVIHGVKSPPTVISIDQLHNFPATYSRCVLVLPSHQMYYTWLMTMYWQVTLIMYVMSQDWCAMWNISARMDIHHTMILSYFTYMQQMYANLMQCHCYSGQHIVDDIMWTELYFVRRSMHS